MCGRITQVASEQEIEEAFSATREGTEGIYRVNYNLGPLQRAAVIGQRDGARVLRMLRWGLVPGWVRDADAAKKMAAMCVNARAEGIETKPAFRAAFARRRSIVPASGYFEWARVGGHKQPYYFYATAGTLLALAGIWERWRDPSTGEELRTFSLVTTEPNAVAARVHDRMPVILGREDWDAWLAPHTSPDALHALLHPCPDDWLAAHRVSRDVGDVRNNAPTLIAPIDGERPARAS